ncbi:MAG: S41 family peptidase [Phenylobacterium sp.]|uniref:S41 family peptidase n=1 Tax=Phenylobacterium sp. TaxID=1871053 RepID=UPI00391DF9F0
MPRRRRIAVALAVAATLSGAPGSAVGADPTAPPPAEVHLSPETLRREFDGWIAAMAATHPDLAGRVDLAELRRAQVEVRAAIRQPMTADEAWRLFARLNPYLRDGHNGVLPADYRGRVQAHLDGGGRVFPFEVRISEAGELYALDADPAGPRRIRTIEGRPAGAVVERLLALAIGDTLRFRQAWVSRRFPLLYWQIYGDPGDYEIGLEARPARRVPGARALPVSAQPAPPAAQLYSRETLPGDIGYLRIDSFAGEHRDALARFARESFAEFRGRGVQALIVDIRENDGGDDPPWQESLMDHITAAPYAHVSRYAVRVTARNARPGETIGAIRRSNFEDRFRPSADNPNRMSAPVYILVGPFTYSAAIQFAVAAQDFSVAKIAGVETGALACQTGQTQAVPMLHTGLNAFAPRAAFTRPSGEGCERGVLPDVPIPVDETNPRAAVEALAQHIRSTAR